MRRVIFHWVSTMRVKKLLAIFLGFSVALSIGTALCVANEETQMHHFRQFIEQANPKRAQVEFMKAHKGPPSKKDIESLLSGIVESTLKAMDAAMAMEREFPQSANLPEVRASLETALWEVFGSKNLRMPGNRAEDVEKAARHLLSLRSNDFRMYMVLCRVASKLPLEQKTKLYKEIVAAPAAGPAKEMAEHALKNLSLVGKPFTVPLKAVDGSPFRIEDFRGKVVLLDFWSTTCVPCVREVPTLKELYSKMQPEGFEIVGISFDKDKTALERFLKKEQLPWPNHFDENAAEYWGETFYVKSIPRAWLIDRQGVLRDVEAQENLEEKIRALLKE